MPPTTFKVSDKRPELVKRAKRSPIPICAQLRAFKREHCSKVLLETNFSATVEASQSNGFVHTAIRCYNEHHNLVIRPDDIWLAIMTQFSYYINRSVEEYRNKFVHFNNRQKLSVTIDGSLRSASYDHFVTKILEKIDENLIDLTVKDWVLPNFSTTTKNDIVSSGVVFMATTKQYLQLQGDLKCGIPNITLEGTTADWESIAYRIEKLKDFTLIKWYEMLKTIVREFIAAKNNRPNIKFWNRMCHRIGGGSGQGYLSGWLSVFSVYDENGNWVTEANISDVCKSCGHDSEGEPWPFVDIAKIPAGIVNVEVEIVDASGVQNYCMMFSGHLGYDVLDDHITMQPQIGWGMCFRFSSEDVKRAREATGGELFSKIKSETFIHF